MTMVLVYVFTFLYVRVYSYCKSMCDVMLAEVSYISCLPHLSFFLVLDLISRFV